MTLLSQNFPETHNRLLAFNGFSICGTLKCRPTKPTMNEVVTMNEVTTFAPHVICPKWLWRSGRGGFWGIIIG